MPSLKNTAFALIGAAASASALTQSPAATTNSKCMYTVPGVGSFTTNLNFDLSGGSLLPSLGNQLGASTYTVASNNAPFSRRFDLTNVGYASGGLFGLTSNALTLTVPGGQIAGPISSAQLVTVYSDILYGSVRTVAKVSSVAGTTHGFTFYANDTQEIDFAFLTTDDTKVHFTNEQVSSTSPSTSYVGTAPSDASTAFHEYRVDWIPGKTMFYIDSVLVQTITGNVPTTPGFWLWNNWSNGNLWAQGPPLKDNVLQIQTINAYFNRTGITSQMASITSSVCGLTA
ncbi:hypothetical protein MBLNU459_g2203t1 [Dothideomycetes sp. NU459]